MTALSATEVPIFPSESGNATATSPTEVPVVLAVGGNGAPEWPATPISPTANHDLLSTDDLKRYAPNELGLIPILQYHVITTDASQEAQFVRPVEKFKADLLWLYDHNFYVVPLRSVVDNRIAAPTGKSPVVLTFDDATSYQFSATVDSTGDLVPTADSAVGLLEDFFAKHPDFGHSAHFSIVPNNCFAVPDESQLPLCHAKLQWLSDHGYEVGNHTFTHCNLGDVSDERFKEEVGKTKQFIDEWVTGPGNQSEILTFPFGEYPKKENHHNQRKWLRKGFRYNGTDVNIKAGLMVGSNPNESPNGNEWDSIFIARIQTFDASLDEWFTAMLDGSAPVYVSDGNPDVVTMPDPLPAYLQNQYDPDAVFRWGLALVEYDPETGEITNSSVDQAFKQTATPDSGEDEEDDRDHRDKPPRN